jgi:hypothetical protein
MILFLFTQISEFYFCCLFKFEIPENVFKEWRYWTPNVYDSTKIH